MADGGDHRPEAAEGGTSGAGPGALARVVAEAEAEVRVEDAACVITLAPAVSFVGRKPSSSKTSQTSAHAPWLLFWFPPRVQSKRPEPSPRNLCSVAAAYAMPAACSMAFPWPMLLLGCCVSFPAYWGKRVSHVVHSRLVRSSLTVPRRISTRAPSRRRL